MRFSETGAKFFTDFMSKHAMHANCAEEVFCAGEFCVEELGDNKWRFIIDNNSGTYAPVLDILPKLAQLFSSNFPDMEVVALDREDPKIVEFRKRWVIN